MNTLTCSDCKAQLLFECPGCSGTNYPPRSPRIPFGHLYRISLGADHPSARRAWDSGGAVFAYGPAPYEGHRGDIEYKNLYSE